MTDVSSSSPIDMNGQLDLSGYPPAPVLWFTALVDTLCIPLQCRQWRDSMGIPNDSGWLAAKLPSLMANMPTYPSFDEYLDDQGLSLSSFQVSGQPIESTDKNSATLWDYMYKYAFETPSTALGDLTTPTALLVLLCLVLLLRCIKSILLPLFSSVGRKMGRRTYGVEWEAANEERIAKFGEYVFRLLFHSSISVFGIYYFWDAEWWSGPNGTMSLYQGFPNHPVQPGMTWYYLFQGAYNFDAMLSLLLISFTVKIQSPLQENAKTGQVQVQMPVRLAWSPTVRGDFQEMMIHHIVTNLLVIGSSLCRVTRIGSMVFLVHDLSDVPVDLSKLANFLKWKWTTLACFLSMVGVWMMTRLYVLPFIIYRSILTQSHYVVEDGFPVLLYVHYRHFFYVLLGLLILLHLAWFVIFLQIFGTFLRKNECHDLSEHKQGEAQNAAAATQPPMASSPNSAAGTAMMTKPREPNEVSEEKKDN